MTTTATTTPPRTRPRPPVRATPNPSGTDRGRTPRPASRSTARPAAPPRSPSRASSRAPGRAAGTATAVAAAPARRSAPPRPRPQLRVVESPADRRRRVLRNRRMVAVGTLLAVLGVFTVVAFHVMLAQGQVRLTRLQEEVSSAERDYQQARYAHARAASPTRIVALATKLGLVPAGRAPLPVAVPEASTPATDPNGAGTLDGYTNVKRSLADGP